MWIFSSLFRTVCASNKIMDRDWTKLILMVLLRQSRCFDRLDIFIKYDGNYIEAIANTEGYISWPHAFHVRTFYLDTDEKCFSELAVSLLKNALQRK